MHFLTRHVRLVLILILASLALTGAELYRLDAMSWRVQTLAQMTEH